MAMKFSKIIILVAITTTSALFGGCGILGLGNCGNGNSGSTSGAWSTGTWSDCSVTCGGGTQTRSVTCSFDSCTGTQPDSSRECNSDDCPYEYPECQETCPTSDDDCELCEEDTWTFDIDFATYLAELSPADWRDEAQEFFDAYNIEVSEPEEGSFFFRCRGPRLGLSVSFSLSISVGFSLPSFPKVEPLNIFNNKYGCDGVFGSGATYDDCGICGGDGDCDQCYNEYDELEVYVNSLGCFRGEGYAQCRSRCDANSRCKLFEVGTQIYFFRNVQYCCLETCAPHECTAWGLEPKGNWKSYAKCEHDCGCDLNENDPVCGEDGETYDSECLADCKGIEIESSGRCPIQCDGNYKYHPGWVQYYKNRLGVYYFTSKSKCRDMCDRNVKCRMYEHNGRTCVLEDCGGDSCDDWRYVGKGWSSWSKCDCDDPDAENNGNDNEYCEYNTPTGGSVTASYRYPRFRSSLAGGCLRGIGRGFGVAARTVRRVRWRLFGRRRLTEGDDIDVPDDSDVEIIYEIEGDDVDALLDITNDPNHDTIMAQAASDETGEEVEVAASAPVSVQIGEAPSCGLSLLNSTCASDAAGDICEVECEFGYNMTFTCVDTDVLLEWQSSQMCVENGESLTQVSTTLTLAFPPDDTDAFLEACSALVELVTCLSVDSRENTLNIIGETTATEQFMAQAIENDVVGIPLQDIYTTYISEFAYGTANTAADCGELGEGYHIVGNQYECEEAASSLGGDWGGIGNWPPPQNCIASVDEPVTFYYNTRTDGEPVPHRRPVCIQRSSPTPTVSTTGSPSTDPSLAPTAIPYRVFVKFISSYGCQISRPRISAMEWNFYDDINATQEIASEFFDFEGTMEDMPSDETPSNLVDDNEDTKWLSFLTCSGEGGDCVCTNEIELHFTLMDQPKYYSFVSEDHGQNRDPAIWNVTFCCAAGSSVSNPYGCGEAMTVNVFEEPWSRIYGPNLGRVEETGKFPLSTCEMGPSQAPSFYESDIPTKTPTKSPHTSGPSMAPFTPSDQPSAAPQYQNYFEWNCTMSDEPTECQEYTRGLTQTCEEAQAPLNETGSDYCCSVSDGSHYCCENVDQSEQNLFTGLDDQLARCTHTDSDCVQSCFKQAYDDTQRICYKICPDDPTSLPSLQPSALCEDQDEVYSMNGTTYWDDTSNRTMTCQQVIDILFINNQKNCTVYFARQCPVACDMCTQIPTPHPSAGPTSSPQEPTVSPSYEPSNPPHEKCSDEYPVIIGGQTFSANCTELTKQLLEGQECSASLSRVCEKSCPNACTEYPSKAPHVSPSTSPSLSPSKGPTISRPTISPSKTPSRTPSSYPSRKPSKAPNLDCVDDEEVIFRGGGSLGFGITCPVAVKVVFDNNDKCEGDLLEQCPDSCGTCTEEPSLYPSQMPSIACYDRSPVYDAENKLLENLNCAEIVLVLKENFGADEPCTDLYARQCPVSCGLCTPVPSPSPTTSLPTTTPSISFPSREPTMNTTFVPTITEQPSSKPTYAGPYACGDNMAQCDLRYNTLFEALVLCQNHAIENCPDVTTECPDVTCPETTACPTCETCPTCPTTAEVETHVDTYDPNLTCETASDWWVGQVIEGLSDFDRTSMTLCKSDGQYMIATAEGRVYPTCVAYVAPGTICTDGDLVCPANPSNPTVAGYAGNHRFALSTATQRNDFRHQDCPKIQHLCEPIEGIYESFWSDLFVERTGLETIHFQNICINPATSELRYVTDTTYVNTCVGFSHEAREVCPDSRTFQCVGLYNGEVVYGWPGQIMETVGRAVMYDSRRHAQCPF